MACQSTLQPPFQEKIAMRHLSSPLIALLLWAATLHVAYAAPPAPTANTPVYYLDLEARRSEASHLIRALSPNISGTDITAQVYAGTLTTVELGVGLAATADTLPVSYGQTLTVSAGARFLYVAVDPGSESNFTLAVGRDDNGNNQPDPQEELCRSADPSVAVQVCSLDKNTLVPGSYWLSVDQPEGTAAAADLLISDGSTLAAFALADVPAAVTSGQPFDARLFWQAPPVIGTARAGVIEIVDQSVPTPVMAPIGFRLTRLPADVAKSVYIPEDELLAPGETFSYIITVLPEPAAILEGITVYTLTDTLPDGVTYVAGSASVTPTSTSGNTLVWQLDTQGVATAITYRTQVGLDTRGVLTNTVVATLDLLGSSSTTAAAAVEVADVILDILMSAPTAVAASPITYTFTIVNEGVSDSDPLTVYTVVPVNAQHSSGGTVDEDGVVTWQLPPLAAGDTTEVQMAVEVFLGMTQLGQRAQVAAATPDIVGGGMAEPGEWPWQVALLRKDTNRLLCGGSLIAPDLVLTAAHCLDGDSTERVADRISVWVGAHDLTELDQGQIIDVSYAALHTNYDPYTTDYDIALLRLAEPAQLSAAVQLVQLATRADENRYRPGTVAAVTGWGSLAWRGDSPDILHEVSVGMVDQDACNAAYSTLYGVPDSITDRMICAGFPEGGKDSCQGDSGGPLVVPDGMGGWLQVGIVSWGAAPEDQPQCAAAGYPGVYASVPTLLSWIEGPGQATYMGPEYAMVTDGSERPGRTVLDYGALVGTVVGQWERVFLPTVTK
jgi:secreted trypsin-like serine protease